MVTDSYRRRGCSRRAGSRGRSVGIGESPGVDQRRKGDLR